MTRPSAHDSVPRLQDWTRMPSGYVQTARCRDCGRLAALPVALLLRRFGALAPIEQVSRRIACSACQSRRAEIRMMRLCDPGCARQRG